jgi:hypothetical protein
MTKIKHKEWDFAKTRQELIDMVKRFAKRGLAEKMAMDIVDCCLVHAWDYQNEQNKDKILVDEYMFLKQYNLIKKGK